MEAERPWQWVNPSRKPSQLRKGYFRHRPKVYDNPTLPMKKARYTFARVAHEKTGVTGKIMINDKEVPPTCEPVLKRMKGKKFTEKPRRVPEALEMLKPILTAIGENVQSFRALNRDILPRASKLPRLLLWQKELKKLEEKLKVKTETS